MRNTSDDRHGQRLRGMIRCCGARVRIQQALALAEDDLDQRRGSLLVRHGKGGRRREVGMDEWGWEQLRPSLEARAKLPVGPLFASSTAPRAGGRSRVPPSAPSSAASLPVPASDAGSHRTSGVTRMRSNSPAGACH
jgi:integrase